MSGDDRVRYCSLCSLNVYDFSEMTRAEVHELLLRTEGRVCAKLYRRADGTMITRDCPTGLRSLQQRVSRFAAAAIAMLFSLSAFASDGKTCVKRGAAITLAIEDVTTSQKATLKGVVSMNGDPLPGVSVLVRNESTQCELAMLTDANGAFAIAYLDDGLYRVEMNLDGWKSAVIEHLEMKSGEVTNARVAMNPLPTTVEMGIVVAEPANMLVDQPLSTTLTQDFINKLPL